MFQPISAAFSFLARLMLTTIFVMSAAGNKIPNFAGVVEYMRGAGVPQPQLALIGAIVFLLVGGVSVALGFQARWGATMLLIFLILATYFFHPFWKVEPERVQAETIQFMKNLALMGAMLFIIVNGPGAGSLDNVYRPKAAV